MKCCNEGLGGLLLSQIYQIWEAGQVTCKEDAIQGSDLTRQNSSIHDFSYPGKASNVLADF